MENTFHVKFEGSEKEFVFRTGAALPVKEPSVVKIDGLITAPGKYWSEKKGLHVGKNSHVLVNRKACSIILVCDEKDPYRTVVSGKLSVNPEFTKFEINNEKKQWSPNELVRLFKMNKHFFSDSSVNASVVTKLSDLKYEVNTKVERNNDFKGNKTDNMRSQLKGDVMPKPFELFINVFDGEKKEKFLVDIEVDVQDSELVCWLVSPGVSGLIQETRDTVIDRELEFLKDIVCLEV
jgi:hypothetical protein